MIINGRKLFDMKPVEPMLDHKVKLNGVSHGLAEVGYDIRIKQDVWFFHGYEGEQLVEVHKTSEFDDCELTNGRFCIASTIERFQMPTNLVGIVHDKSTWARKGLSVFNTVIEPGFVGGLTIELVYHGQDDLHIPAGSGIAQVIFHEIDEIAVYNGKYQNQSSEPVKAIFEA